MTDPATHGATTPVGGVPVGVAVSVQAGNNAVPPLSLVTVLMRAELGRLVDGGAPDPCTDRTG